jgi:hypothetical protein
MVTAKSDTLRRQIDPDTSHRQGTPEKPKFFASGSAYRDSNPWGQPFVFKNLRQLLL